MVLIGNTRVQDTLEQTILMKSRITELQSTVAAMSSRMQDNLPGVQHDVAMLGEVIKKQEERLDHQADDLRNTSHDIASIQANMDKVAADQRQLYDLVERVRNNQEGMVTALTLIMDNMAAIRRSTDEWSSWKKT